MTTSKMFFVRHMSELDYRPNDTATYEVQLLDAAGRSRAKGYFGVDDTQLTVNGEDVPLAVLNAARASPVGRATTAMRTDTSQLHFDAARWPPVSRLDPMWFGTAISRLDDGSQPAAESGATDCGRLRVLGTRVLQSFRASKMT